ncbi:MAG: replication factor C small subunit [Candidatus Aenigmarchaeota archaeon]|nr:replication factor C small subunit [Candidatus Aenigmarchaeota archaeon]
MAAAVNDPDELKIWAEKYRPHGLSDVIDQKHAVERIKAFVAAKNVPHMLFAGPAGVGKTTVALAVAHDLYGKDVHGNVLELNASNERGIDVIRNKVKEFARTRTMSSIGYRLIILDEADALTSDAQNALRRTMETYASVSRFILICNWSSKIIDPIQSRCAVFRFHGLAADDQKKFLERIEKGEKLSVDSSAKDAIIYLAEGDLRKIANLAQSAASAKKKITEELVYEIASRAKPVDVKLMLELALAGNFAAARKKLQDLLFMQGLSGQDIMREMHRQLDSVKADERTKAELASKVGEYEFRISQGGSDLVQLEAFLAQLSLCAKR